MFTAIFGWFWIAIGCLFLLRPQFLKKRLQKRALKKTRKYLFIISVIIGLTFISTFWKVPGIFSKVLVIIGIFAIIKGFLFLKSKSYLKLIDWFSGRPLIFFRCVSLFYILLGVLILVRSGH